MQDQTVAITANRQISPDYYELEFTWKPAWGVPRAGQFMELRVADITAPLLRRPFAFSGYDPDRAAASMIYQVRGQGTQMLQAKGPGETVRILGPLGNAFGLAGAPAKVIALAGGVGLGPILFAARVLAAAGSDVKFIAGFRTRDLIPDRRLWDGLDTALCTDDGSDGFAGNVVDYLRTLADADLQASRLMACGPMPMLKAAHGFAADAGVVCEVSVEEMMACGLGVCVGCVVKTAAGTMARVCTDGPVFESETLIWD